MTVGELTTFSTTALPMPYIKDMGGKPTQSTFTSNQMRKIESQMNAAINAGRDWSSSNTSVHFNEEEQVAVVRLHGNKIAEVGDGFMTIFDGGWQTVTTKSRLNALFTEFCEPGEGVFQKAYQWFVCANGITVPFESGMTLR